MVVVGFTPPEVTKTTAVDDEQVLHIVARPHSLTTERSGSLPIRAVPIRCQPPSGSGS